MPVYEYKCSKCGAAFEKLVNLESREKQRCPVCGSTETEKLLSPISVMGGDKSCGSAEDSSTCGIKFG